MINITDKNYSDFLDKKILVIDFYADWCGPCKMYAPLFEQVSKKEDLSEVVFLKCNADENPALRNGFKIDKFPTTMIVTPNGNRFELRKKLLGVQGPDRLYTTIKEVIPSIS